MNGRKKCMCMLVCFVLQAVVFGADVKWDGGGADDNWTTAENWVGDVLPGSSDRVYLDVAGETTVIEAGDSISVSKILGPCNDAVGTVTLTVQGELTNPSYFKLGREIGGTGILNIDGGTVTTRDLVVADGDGFIGIVNLGAGLLDIYGTGGTTGAFFGSTSTGSTTGSATINVTGGTLNIDLLHAMGENALIDIAGGEMILAGDQTTLVEDYENLGQIVADGGASSLSISTFEDGGNMYTLVVPEPSTICLLGLGVIGFVIKGKKSSM